MPLNMTKGHDRLVWFTFMLNLHSIEALMLNVDVDVPKYLPVGKSDITIHFNSARRDLHFAFHLRPWALQVQPSIFITYYHHSNVFSQNRRSVPI